MRHGHRHWSTGRRDHHDMQVYANDKIAPRGCRRTQHVQKAPSWPPMTSIFEAVRLGVKGKTRPAWTRLTWLPRSGVSAGLGAERVGSPRTCRLVLASDSHRRSMPIPVDPPALHSVGQFGQANPALLAFDRGRSSFSPGPGGADPLGNPVEVQKGLAITTTPCSLRRPPTGNRSGAGGSPTTTSRPVWFVAG